jgi:hypothetical protein
MTAQTLTCPPVAVPRGTASGRRVGLLVVLLSALVVLGALAAGAVALFGSRTVDAASVEAEVERVTRGLGISPTSVSCPADVPVEVGATFRCAAALDGESVAFEVRQNDDRGDVTISSVGFVVLPRVEATLVEQLRDGAGFAATADCAPAGRQVVVGGPGTTIDCTVAAVADPADAARVVGTVTDGQGTVSFASGA